MEREAETKVRKSVIIFAVTSSLVSVLLLAILVIPRPALNTKESLKNTNVKSSTSTNPNINQKSGHFTVEGNAQPSLQSKAEEYYEAIPFLTSLPAGETLSLNNITINVFSNREEYAKETGMPDWSEGFADYQNKEISIVQSNSLTNSILPHEISHLFFDSYMNYERKDINWLDEGLATYVQLKYDKEQAASLADAMASIRDGKYIKLTELSDFQLSQETAVTEVNLYYAQTLSVVDYLISDAKKWTLLLEKIKAKKQFTVSLQESYSEDLTSLEQKWLSYLKDNKQDWER